MNLKEALLSAYEAKASDLHLMPERPVMARVFGRLRVCGEGELSAKEAEEILNALLPRAQRRELEENGRIETAVTAFGFLRVRISAYRYKESYAASLHMLTLKIPDPKELLLPPSVLELAQEKKGLILIDGEAGCGKSTTAASLLSKLAEESEKSIITIESPVEYLLPQGKSLIMQKQANPYEGGYAAALREALRQDPDVIFVDRLCDAETVLLAVTAVEMGYLVFSSLPVGQTEQALYRLVDCFEDSKQEEIRRRLSDALKGIVTQQLLPRADLEGRNAVFEILKADSEIRALIREGRFSQIYSAMEGKESLGMQTMDDAILASYMKSEISAETAVSYSLNREEMQRRMEIY